jgi:hypothetical protein
MYVRRKVKKQNGKISNLLQNFQVCLAFTAFIILIIRLTGTCQATLAFDPRFLDCAKGIEVAKSPASMLTKN